MEVIGIDKTLKTMEEAMERFEQDAGYQLTDSDKALFQYSWIVSATYAMKSTMKQMEEMEKGGGDNAS